MPSMSPSARPPASDSGGVHEASRRDKLRRLVELGIDPWGQRFDDHQPIGVIRKAASHIAYRTEAGTESAPPAEDQFKEWLAQQPPGELHGPRVRAAGRIVLQRKAGKLVFLNLWDWTGQVQVLVG